MEINGTYVYTNVANIRKTNINSSRMKKLIFIIAIFLVLGFQKHETGIDYSNNDVMKYLQANTDEGYCIMLAFLENCDENTKINGKNYSHSEYLELFFKKAESTLDSIQGVGTLIHESIHGLNKQGFFYYNYFLNCNKTIKVKRTSIFKSRKIIEIIPDSCKTHRFGYYIDINSNNNVTQYYGIYGLLDEFLAYYKGVKSEYDFKTKINDSLYLEGRVASEMQAFYEFKYYIITYLIYAEDNHRRKFIRIMNNNDFKKVFEYVDTNFAILVNKFIDDGGTISWKGKDNYHCIINTLQTSEYQDMLNRIY